MRGEKTLTLDTLLEVAREFDVSFSDVVARFVGHPDTVDQFLTLARKAGATFEETWPPPLTGIPFVRDDTKRRGFIEGRNHRDELIRVFALVAGTIYEYTDLELYHAIVLTDHVAMADRMLRHVFSPPTEGARG